MRRLSRVMTTVTSVAALALIAGCGEDNPTPSAAPSPPASASESPATSTPPIPPAAIDQKSRRGVIEAVRFFLDTMAYSGDNGTVSEYRATYDRTCTKCEAIASGIERTYASGGSIAGGGWSPTSFKVYSIDGDTAVLDVVVDYAPQSFVAERGAAVDKVPAQKGVLKAFQMSWDGRWRVGALDPEA